MLAFDANAHHTFASLETSAQSHNSGNQCGCFQTSPSIGLPPLPASGSAVILLINAAKRSSLHPNQRPDANSRSLR